MIASMVNIINRIAWNLVALFDIDSPIIPKQKYNIFAGSYLKLSFAANTPLIKRAFANNCKYIVQVGKLTQFS